MGVVDSVKGFIDKKKEQKQIKADNENQINEEMNKSLPIIEELNAAFDKIKKEYNLTSKDKKQIKKIKVGLEAERQYITGDIFESSNVDAGVAAGIMVAGMVATGGLGLGLAGVATYFMVNGLKKDKLMKIREQAEQYETEKKREIISDKIGEKQADAIKLIDEVKAGRSAEDVVREALGLGLNLDTNIEQ